MRSFPSALNRGGNSALTSAKVAGTEVSSNQYGFDISRMKAYNLSLNTETRKELLKQNNMNISNFARYPGLTSLGDNHVFPNVTVWDEQIVSMNYNTAVGDTFNGSKSLEDIGVKTDTNKSYRDILNDIDKEESKIHATIREFQDKIAELKGKSYGSGSQEKKSEKKKDQAKIKELEEKIKKEEEKLSKFNAARTEVNDKAIENTSMVPVLDENGKQVFNEDGTPKMRPMKGSHEYLGIDADEDDLMFLPDEVAAYRSGARGNDYRRVSKPTYYENPFKLPSGIIASMNRYKHVYKVPTVALYDAGVPSGAEATEENIELAMTATLSVPSMFNPICNIQAVGMTDNVPILNDVSDDENISAGYELADDGSNTINVTAHPGKQISDRDLTNCTIKELVSLSHMKNSILGLARYKYADFMYCKDVGKVSNNHLITLRKFAHPVGDNIFKTSASKYANQYEKGLFDYTGEGDTGRLIAWFDTDDNKLEDILNYKYSASWKELNSKIQEVESQEDQAERGPLGMLLNSVNPSYNKACLAGTGGSHNLFSHFGSKWFNIPQGGNSQNTHMQRMYDNNKVYTPKNTIQDTHLYEGKLKFEQEITLRFSYKLRAYDNINPKTAFLDLLANILEVTYRRGKFWGGARRFIGSPANRAGWNKANKFIDEQWDKLGGFLQGIASGTIDWQSIVQSAAAAVESLKNAAQGAIQDIKDKVNGNGGGAQGVMRTIVQGMIDLNKKTGFTHGLKAQLKNAVGRPAMYAMDSLLSADNVGLWHLTIGNPKNPIIAMGNLILTGASIQHKGPLGVDDFPTELTVTVTLKPGRSRDLTEIGRMYTKGGGSLYQTVDRNKIKDFFEDKGQSTSKDTYTNIEDKMIAAQSKRRAAVNKALGYKVNDETGLVIQETKKEEETTNEQTEETEEPAVTKSKTRDKKKRKAKTKAKPQEDKPSKESLLAKAESESWLDPLFDYYQDIDGGDDWANFSPYINTETALRYETHGQDHALGARLIIDEQA